MKKIGILGGTFNPIHNGHIMLGIEAYKQFKLDTILVMPNKIPAYKSTSQILDTEHRSNMAKLAIMDYSYMEFSDIELQREGNTYTVDTLYELHKKYPKTELYFILGGDSLAYLDKWYHYTEILQQAVILCARRGNDDYGLLAKYKDELIKNNPKAIIEFLQNDMIDISSTELRNKIANKEDVSNWISESVANYIQKNHLYE